MENNPLVSILIPNFNKAQYLRETLDSVLAQTYTNWECIIVDDHSTDGSWEILVEYVGIDTRFQLHKRPDERKPGGNAARNFAFELSYGEFINWFDSDDIMDQKMIEEKLNLVKLNHSLDFVLGNAYSFEEKKSLNERKNIDYLEIKKAQLALMTLRGDFWIPTPSPLFRRKFLNELDYLFHEGIIRGQESEFFVRVLLKNPHFLLCPNANFYWRKNENSKTSQHKLKPIGEQLKSSFLSYKLIYLSFENFNEIDDNTRLYFSKIFQTCLSYIPINSMRFYEVLFFGFKKNVFENKVIILKIILVRIFPFLIRLKFK